MLARRGPNRRVLDPRRTYLALVEPERSASGEVVPVATLFLTNRECPLKCLICDLWAYTLEESVRPGAVPEQIRTALAGLPPARQIKLYNAGSFFDRKAIPPADLAEIARLCEPFERTIVECHPALVGDAALQFHDDLGGRLEIAVGLETVHPTVFPRLNKAMSLDLYRETAERLQDRGIALRSFLIVGLPFVGENESAEWTRRSIEFALEAGSSVVSLIPTRAGNGAMDALAARGEFFEPSLDMLEAALEFGVGLGRGRVFADLWDLDRFSRCPVCLPARRQRMERINLEQIVPPPVACNACR